MRWAMSRHASLLALLLVACGGEPATPVEAPPPETASTGSEEASPPPEGRLPSDVRPLRYALDLAIDPTSERFTGAAEIDVSLPAQTRTIYLHGKGLDVTTATVAVGDAEPFEASWEVVDEESGLARLSVPQPIGPGEVQLRVNYSAPFDRTLTGFYRVEQEDRWYVFSQMEPLGARRAFPCFDEPSFKTPFDVTMVVGTDDIAIANAAERSSEEAAGDHRRVRFETTEPLPTYLVAIAVGPFDVVEGTPIAASDVRSEPIPLRGIAAHGQGPRLAHALEHTPAILTALEDYFGIPYPYGKLDLIAVPDFPAGAMENAGAITFRDILLLVGEDAPIRQQRGFAYVTAHELAHQWFGNLVTTAWWDDLWLNEAFATWMETQTIAATFPHFEPQIAEMGVALGAMDADSLGSARQIRQPIESEHDIHNAFDRITYSKGNAMLAMFERWLTPEVFRRGVQIYLREHAAGNATAADLLAALSAAAERDVSGPFESFLNQPGVPLVDVTPRCEGGEASLGLRQSRYLPLGSAASAEATWQIPFCARYRAGGETRRACTLLTETEGTLALPGGCADWVMPNAGGVGYYRWTLPSADLEALRQRGLGELDIREAMSFADSIEAGFAAGRTPYADAMGALEPLAARDERVLATAPIELTTLAMHRLLDDAGRARAARHVTRLYRRRARSLGWSPRTNEDPETQLLRAELFSFLALVVEDRNVLRDAERRGRAYVGFGGDGEIHPDAVVPDLAALTVMVAVRQGGEPVFDHVLAGLRDATDPVVRGNLLRGLAATRDDALRARLLGLTLDGEVLRVNEVFRPLMVQAEEPTNHGAVFSWLMEHYDAVAGRIGPGFAGYLPYVGAGFCTTERATEVRAFFAERVGATHGGPRNLESAVERIGLCASRVEFARDSASTFFTR